MPCAQLSKSPAERSRSAERSRLHAGLAERDARRPRLRVLLAARRQRERAQRQRRSRCASPARTGPRGDVADAGALEAQLARRPSSCTDSLPERLSSPSSDAAPSGSFANSSSASLISSESVAASSAASGTRRARGTRAAGACCSPSRRRRRSRAQQHLQVRLLGRGPLGHQRARLAGGDAAARLLGRDARQHARAPSRRLRRLHAAASAPAPATSDRHRRMSPRISEWHVFDGAAWPERRATARGRARRRVARARRPSGCGPRRRPRTRHGSSVTRKRPASTLPRVVHHGERQVVSAHRLRGAPRVVVQRDADDRQLRVGAVQRLQRRAASAGRGGNRRRRSRRPARARRRRRYRTSRPAAWAAETPAAARPAGGWARTGAAPPPPIPDVRRPPAAHSLTGT